MSDEHGERFNYDIPTTKKCYQGKWALTMLGDYSLQLKGKTQIGTGQTKWENVF
jgi:hypothetical protein